MILSYLKRGSYHTFFLTATSIVSRAISFLFLPFFLSKLTLAEFGVWDFYQHFFSLGTLLVSSGAATALTRFYILYKDEPIKQKQVIGNACAAVMALALTLIILSPLLLVFLRHCALGVEYFFTSVILSCLFSFFSIILAYFRVSEQLWSYAFIFCTQAFIATMLTVLGLKLDAGISSFFYAHGCSLLFFLPIFCSVTLRHWHHSWTLLQEQIAYSLPLLLYNFLYMGFFTIDRLMVKLGGGYEALGVYAMLWRFGALYQFFSLALVNAAPIVIFNAHKEEHGVALIQKLLTYACTLLILGGIFSIYATRFALARWFAAEYATVAPYVPFFFLFLPVLEVARFMQTGFHLATKTVYIPFLSAIALGVQAALLWILSSYGIVGVCSANTCTFLVYAALSCILGYRVYSHHIIDYARLSLLLIAFFSTVLALCYLSVSWIYVAIGWILLLWFGIVTHKEKRWLQNKFAKNNYDSFLGAYTHVVVGEHQYSKKISHERIAILGPYPPPLGGISVHIKRVGAFFQQQQNAVSYFDTINRPRVFVYYLVTLSRFLLRTKPSVVYYHTPYSYRGAYEFSLLVFFQRWQSFKLILVEHDARYFKELVWFQQCLIKWCVRHVYEVIFIGNTPYLCYAAHAMLPVKFSIEGAFLPPDPADEDKILTSYPESLRKFMNQHYPLILANAFQLRILNDVDLYGFDMCLDLLKRLHATYPSVGLVFVLAIIGNEDYYAKMESRARELGIDQHLFVLHGQKELWPLFKYVDVFVRPTSTDNYGISVAESLYFDVPAIASDVCVRPAGTILFLARDIDDFYDKVSHVLHERIKGDMYDDGDQVTSMKKIG